MKQEKVPLIRRLLGSFTSKINGKLPKEEGTERGEQHTLESLCERYIAAIDNVKIIEPNYENTRGLLIATHFTSVSDLGQYLCEILKYLRTGHWSSPRRDQSLVQHKCYDWFKMKESKGGVKDTLEIIKCSLVEITTTTRSPNLVESNMPRIIFPLINDLKEIHEFCLHFKEKSC